MDVVAKWILGLALVLSGIGYVLLRLAADAMADPDPGAWGGWRPLLAGLAVAVVGAAVLIF